MGAAAPAPFPDPIFFPPCPCQHLTPPPSTNLPGSAGQCSAIAIGKAVVVSQLACPTGGPFATEGRQLPLAECFFRQCLCPIGLGCETQCFTKGKNINPESYCPALCWHEKESIIIFYRSSNTSKTKQGQATIMFIGGTSS